LRGKSQDLHRTEKALAKGGSKNGHLLYQGLVIGVIRETEGARGTRPVKRSDRYYKMNQLIIVTQRKPTGRQGWGGSDLKLCLGIIDVLGGKERQIKESGGEERRKGAEERDRCSY